MKAIRLLKTGSPLEEQEIAVPQVGAHDVLIRVMAAGICHSDAHYRAGVSQLKSLPLTLGHEIAGVVEHVGSTTQGLATGDRVCVHYLATCGRCDYCATGTEQFCRSVQMLGKDRDGGYAEFVAVPERSVFRLPAEIPFEQGAILMCSSATSLHALNKARLRPGETVAIYGVGGLGISALQLARISGAAEVFAVDTNPRKLELATRFGAIPVNALAGDPVNQIRKLTGGRGVDVALELIGLPLTMRQAVQSLAILGRAALVGLTGDKFEVAPYARGLEQGSGDHRRVGSSGERDSFAPGTGAHRPARSITRRHSHGPPSGRGNKRRSRSPRSIWRRRAGSDHAVARCPLIFLRRKPKS